jgi:hypothetical protein
MFWEKCGKIQATRDRSRQQRNGASKIKRGSGHVPESCRRISNGASCKKYMLVLHKQLSKGLGSPDRVPTRRTTCNEATKAKFVQRSRETTKTKKPATETGPIVVFNN